MSPTNDSLDQKYAAQLQDPGVRSWRSSLTVKQMVDLYDEAWIEVSTPFDCNPAWTKKKACRMVESAAMNHFIPEVYLRRTLVDGNPYYQMVDGKQRFLTLGWFYKNGDPWEKKSRPDIPDEFRLSGCRRMPLLNGLTFDDFPEAMKMAFASYDLGAIVVEGKDDAAVSETLKLLSQHAAPMTAEQMGKRLKRWNIRTLASAGKIELAEVTGSETGDANNVERRSSIWEEALDSISGALSIPAPMLESHSEPVVDTRRRGIFARNWERLLEGTGVARSKAA